MLVLELVYVRPREVVMQLARAGEEAVRAWCRTFPCSSGFLGFLVARHT